MSEGIVYIFKHLLISNGFNRPFKGFRKGLKSDIRHCECGECLDPPLTQCILTKGRSLWSFQRNLWYSIQEQLQPAKMQYYLGNYQTTTITRHIIYNIIQGWYNGTRYNFQSIEERDTYSEPFLEFIKCFSILYAVEVGCC